MGALSPRAGKNDLGMGPLGRGPTVFLEGRKSLRPLSLREPSRADPAMCIGLESGWGGSIRPVIGHGCAESSDIRTFNSGTNGLYLVMWRVRDRPRVVREHRTGGGVASPNRDSSRPS